MLEIGLCATLPWNDLWRTTQDTASAHCRNVKSGHGSFVRAAVDPGRACSIGVIRRASKARRSAVRRRRRIPARIAQCLRLDVAARFTTGFRPHAELNRSCGSGAGDCHFPLPRLQTASVAPLNVDVHVFLVALAQMSLLVADCHRKVDPPFPTRASILRLWMVNSDRALLSSPVITSGKNRITSGSTRFPILVGIVICSTHRFVKTIS
jgi:hypothetical protein